MKPQRVNGVDIPYEESTENLLRYIDANSEKKWAAFAALGQKSESQIPHILLKYSESSDPHMRRTALETLASCRNASSVLPSLRKYLKDPYDFVVSQTCSTLAALEDMESHGELVDTLKHPSPAVRISVLLAMRTLWTESDFSAALRVLKNDSSSHVKKEAALLLMHHVNRETWTILFKEFQSDSLHHHRVWACKLIELFGDKKYQNDLLNFLKDNDGHVRKAAQKALAIISTKD